MNNEVCAEQSIQQVVNTLLNQLHTLSEAKVTITGKKKQLKKMQRTLLKEQLQEELEDNMEIKHLNNLFETIDESEETLRKKVIMWEMMQIKLELDLLELENFEIDLNELKIYLLEWEKELEESLDDLQKKDRKDSKRNVKRTLLKKKMLKELYDEVTKMEKEHVRKHLLLKSFQLKLIKIVKEIDELECDLAASLGDVKEFDNKKEQKSVECGQVNTNMAK